MSEITLPVGVLRAHEDGLLAVRLPAGRPGRKAVDGWLHRLAAVKARGLLLPRRLTERPFGLELEYPDESRKTTPLAGRLAEWAAEPRAAVPQVLSLARFTLSVAAELAAAGDLGVPVGPAFVRHLPGATPPWRLVPVPAADVTLADWAGADADAWLWSSLPGLGGGRATDPIHALGAALHHALLGGLFAETLTRRETFGRLLRGRVGLTARVEGAARAAVPAACAAEAAAMSGLILDCLGARRGARLTIEEAGRRLGELEKQLSADRLPRLWEAEYRPDVATLMRERQKPPAPPPPEPPPPGVSWSDVARRRFAEGDWAEALEAAWQAVRSDGPAYCRLYLWLVQQIAGRLPRPRTDVANAIDRLTTAMGPRLDEGDLLRVAHLKARYLGTPEAELGRIDRAYESRWNEGVALLLRAWLQVRKGDGFIHASRLCKESRQRFQAMPEGGGDAGTYARAYLDLLDGIAHVGYVSTTGTVGYYAEAFTRFTRSYELAGRSAAEDLARASCRWLVWLGQLTSLLPDDPAMVQVHRGVQAILQAQGLLAESQSLTGVPEIPAYDDDRLFPL
jgi:hypothetical protein